MRVNVSVRPCAACCSAAVQVWYWIPNTRADGASAGACDEYTVYCTLYSVQWQNTSWIAHYIVYKNVQTYSTEVARPPFSLTLRHDAIARGVTASSRGRRQHFDKFSTLAALSLRFKAKFPHLTMMSTRSRFLSEEDAREEARHYVFIFFYVLGFALLVPFSPDGTFLGPREQSITALASLPRENEAVDLQWEEMKLWDNLDRRVRFPSKEQRLKIYMGHWYEQCGPRIRFQQVNATHVVVEEPSGRKLELSNYPDTDGTFWVEPSEMDACANSTWRLHFYCKDAANLTKAERPLLLQFGDARDSRQFG